MERYRIKTRLIGGLAVVVAIIAIAFALGGSGTSKSAKSVTATGEPATGGHENTYLRGSPESGSVPLAPAPAASPPGEQTAPEFGVATGAGSTAASGTTSSLAPPHSVNRAVNAADSNSASGVAATRIVKTGSLDLRVNKGAVQSTMTSLAKLASANGGYVARSTTDTNTSSPNGQIELRVPVAQFTNTVNAAEALGHVTLLTTSAQDVTGKYVDLAARMQALQHTRSTYLTILSRATTIGATLSVQQRIDDSQQQIDELHGEIKLLASQSSFATLDVNVDQPSVVPVAKAQHRRHGLSKAWHTSISRFNRGIDAIVSGLGPLLLAVLLIGLVIGVGRLGLRGARRHRSPDVAG